MRRRHYVVLGAGLALLALLVVAYAWDNSRSDLIADGITVDGVDVGGLRANQATEKLTDDLAEPSKQPLKVKYGGVTYRLSPERAKLNIDIAGTVDTAEEKSRSGGIFGRTWRAVTGGSIDENVPVEIAYSRDAARSWTKEIATKIDRPPQDASLSFSGDSIGKVPGRSGVAVNRRALTARVNSELDDLRDRRVVRPRVRTVKPAVTTDELASKYPTVLTVDRAGFTVRLWKRLQLDRTYQIAIGRAGYDSPAGLYSIQSKQVDPVWNVPNKKWAGKLAGKTIPPGPDNPLKARWMGVYDGVGFHGTDDEGSIGTAASHGCFRMRVADIVALFPRVEVGAPVYIS